MHLPTDEIMKDLGWFLVVSGGALPLDFEIIERCDMAAGFLDVSVIVA
jgi:hypothetical protein